jgi:hypothetical protein
MDNPTICMAAFNVSFRLYSRRSNDLTDRLVWVDSRSIDPRFKTLSSRNRNIFENDVDVFRLGPGILHDAFRDLGGDRFLCARVLTLEPTYMNDKHCTLLERWEPKSNISPCKKGIGIKLCFLPRQGLPFQFDAVQVGTCVD